MRFSLMGQVWSVHEPAFIPRVAQRLQALSVASESAIAEARTHFAPIVSATPDVGILVDAAALAREERLPLRVVDGVAVIGYHGPTVRRLDLFLAWLGYEGYDRLTRAIEVSIADSAVVAIALDMDTPGGTVDGLADFSDTIIRANKRKPVVASINGGVFSAGVHAAVGASKILIGQTDETGNVGTRSLIYDFSTMFEREGIRAVVNDSGPYKSLGAMGTAITEDHEKHLQELVDWHAAEFFDRVAKHRRLNSAKLKAVTDGKVWVAPRALELGMVDQIGSLADAIDMARKLGRQQRRGQSRAAATLATVRAVRASTAV